MCERCSNRPVMQQGTSTYLLAYMQCLSNLHIALINGILLDVIVVGIGDDIVTNTFPVPVGPTEISQQLNKEPAMSILFET